MYYAYILQSKHDGDLYIGVTHDLRRRLYEHNRGKTYSTHDRRPFILLFYEALPTFDEARAREVFYKSGRGHEVLKKILFKTLEK